jgi:uncharacterized damage-inducible protein DinB/putative sterol carrier protein
MKMTDRMLRNERDFTAAVPLFVGVDFVIAASGDDAAVAGRAPPDRRAACSANKRCQEKEQNMNQINSLERLFRYKAQANDEILAAMRPFEDAIPAKEIAIRALTHTYVVDRIFAANLMGVEHGYTSANKSQAPTLEELSEAIRTSDQWYIDYVSRLENGRLAERIDFTFTDGAPGRMSREEMLLHVAIHGGYHRGQVGWIMMENSITPPADGFTSYLHKAEASARRRSDASSDPVKNHSTANRLNARFAGERSGETPAKEGRAMSRLDALTERMRAAVGADSDLGKTLKFNLKGEGFIYIDSGSVTNEDKPADLTLTVTIDDLRAIGQGKLSPTTAVITGRLGLSDMGVAMGLRGKMQELFSKMQPAS